MQFISVSEYNIKISKFTVKDTTYRLHSSIRKEGDLKQLHLKQTMVQQLRLMKEQYKGKSR